jgi:hypothetical protein
MDLARKRLKVSDIDDDKIVVSVNNYGTISRNMEEEKFEISLLLRDVYANTQCYPFIVKSHGQELHAIVSKKHKQIVYLEPAAQNLSQQRPMALLGDEAMDYAVFTFARKTKRPHQVMRLVSFMVSFLTQFPDIELRDLFMYICAASSHVVAFDSHKGTTITWLKRYMKCRLNEILNVIPIVFIQYYIDDDNGGNVEMVDVPDIPQLPTETLRKEILSHAGVKYRAIDKSAEKMVEGGIIDFSKTVPATTPDRLATLITQSKKVILGVFISGMVGRIYQEPIVEVWQLLHHPQIVSALSKTKCLSVSSDLLQSSKYGLFIANVVGEVLQNPKCNISRLECIGYTFLPKAVEQTLSKMIRLNTSVKELRIATSPYNTPFWMRMFAHRQKNLLTVLEVDSPLRSQAFLSGEKHLLEDEEQLVSADDFSALIFNNIGSLKRIGITRTHVRISDKPKFDALVTNVISIWKEPPRDGYTFSSLPASSATTEHLDLQWVRGNFD